MDEDIEKKPLKSGHVDEYLLKVIIIMQTGVFCSCVSFL